MYVHYYFVRRRASVPLQCVAFTFKIASINIVSSYRHLSTLALVWKLILLSLGCMFLICSFCLLFWCSNIVMLLVRIFRNSVVGHECWYINQFPPNIIKSIRQYEKINKKICRQKMFIMFNEICTHIHAHTYTLTHSQSIIYLDNLKAYNLDDSSNLLFNYASF